MAGIAGLTPAQCPSLWYADIKSAILNTVDKVPAAAGKIVSEGRVNAFAALTSILLPGDLTGDCRIGVDDAIVGGFSQACRSCSLTPVLLAERV